MLQGRWTLPDYHTGETLHLFLYWRNAQAPGNYSFAVRLSDWRGAMAEEIPATLEVTSATPGLLRQQIDFPIRAYVGSGGYALSVVAGQAWAGLGDVHVTASAPVRAADRSPDYQAQSRFEGGITLVGYSPKLTQGKLDLTLYWNAADPVDRPYKLFAHLFGPTINPATGNASWAQWDAEPGSGSITTWRAGQTIATVVELAPPANRPAGQYHVEVGWYDGLTGQRLMRLNAGGEAIDSQAVLGAFTWPAE